MARRNLVLPMGAGIRMIESALLAEVPPDSHGTDGLSRIGPGGFTRRTSRPMSRRDAGATLLDVIGDGRTVETAINTAGPGGR